jgi:fructose-1,6-bisphosphatase I/sedoheptulose-1,7-bisphosphatase
VTTLDGHLADLAACDPADGEAVAELVHALSRSVARIAGHLARGALDGHRGETGTRNVHGEAQRPLDQLSDDVIAEETLATGRLAALASEEAAGLRTPSGGHGPYLLAVDPLDGSSNLDVNVGVGTIFSILRSPRPGEEPRPQDFRQAGTAQLCAGFAMYGPSTVLVLTTGSGVDAFTLDPATGRFLLTHPQLRIPERSDEFAINASNARFWEQPVRRYVADCLAGAAGPRGRDTNMRWVASLVADVYRILSRGGVFLYPRDTREPLRPGRLRLLYECNPVAFIVEQAGGAALSGHARTLDLAPDELHQKVPFVFGSAHEVTRIEDLHRRQDWSDDAGFDSSLFNRRSLFRAG